MPPSRAKSAAGNAAAESIPSGARIALGTGSTIETCLPALATISGLTATPTSSAIAEKAASHGIKFVPVHDEYDVYIDGADQVSPSGHVIKGSWGAHVREKSLSRLSRQRILVCDESKLVPALVGPVPVAVVPFLAGMYSAREVTCLDENGLALVGVDSGATIQDPIAWEASINISVGVVATGMFTREMIDEIFIGREDGTVEKM